MSRDLSAIYDAAFFESYNEEQDTDIRAATDVIVDVLRPKTAIDIGCGPGMLVHRLRILGVDAVGVDGSANAYLKAKPEVRPYLEIADVTRVEYMKGADLVICTEVAEHVPAERSDNLVSTLCRSAE
jgi:2-polyprenyl-3-methyl-5-hydroxy-6-metoxy-1,4-benzoquinol methylase